MNQTALPTETLFARATRDFFTHSGHVPLVIMILEAILAKPGYFLSIDPYLLLVAGVSQAFLMAWLGGRSRIWVILGNLSGPLFIQCWRQGLKVSDFSSNRTIRRIGDLHWPLVCFRRCRHRKVRCQGFL